MMIERAQSVQRGEDDDRPADLFMKVVKNVPGRFVERSIGARDPEQPEKADRMALRPAPSEAEPDLRHQQSVEQIVNRLRPELDPARFDRRHLVPRDQPPHQPGDDHRGQQQAERHMDALHAFLRWLGEPVPAFGQPELDDDQQRGRPVKGDRDIVVIGAVVAAAIRVAASKAGSWMVAMMLARKKSQLEAG